MYASNTRTSNNFRQKVIELQGKLEQSTTTVRDFNTSLSGMGRWSRQKIIKDTVGLKSTNNQLDTTDISGLFHPTTADYVLLKLTWNR